MARRILNKLCALFRRDAFESDMREEMDAHLEQAVERLKARGVPEEEARRAARREFGNIPLLQEEGRDARGVLWLESLLADVRFAFRTFRRTPLSTATIVVILALGLGVNTALFTFMHSALTLPAPGIPRDDSLIRIRSGEIRSIPGFPNARVARPISYLEFQGYMARTDLFSGAAAWTETEVHIEPEADGSSTFSAQGQYVTDGYFSLLGVRPVLGPGLPRVASDDSLRNGVTAPAAVISHGIWNTYFGRSPETIGHTVLVNGVPVTLVGVAPPRFSGVNAYGKEMAVWLSLSSRALIEKGSPHAFSSFDSTIIHGVVARLLPGVSIERATSSIATVSDHAATMASSVSGRPDRSYLFDLAPLLADNFNVGQRSRAIYSALPIGVLSLLALGIVCTNVAGLLAAAALVRKREIAVRLALGAGRARIVRQLLTESVLRAIIGGLLGAFLLFILVRTLGHILPTSIEVFDPMVFLFVFGVAITTGILLGLLPSLHATRTSVADDLRASSPGMEGSHSHLPRAFVIAQIALSQPLLAGIMAFLLLMAGGWFAFRPSEVNDRIVEVDPGEIYRQIPLEEQADLTERLLVAMEGIPGVEKAITGPLNGQSTAFTIHPEDRVGGETPNETLWLEWKSVPQGYFNLMNMKVLLGTPPSQHSGVDESASRETFIGTDTARKLFGIPDPVGRRLVAVDSGEETIIAGVVDETDAAYQEFDVDRFAFIYRVRSSPNVVLPRFLVRTTSPSASIIPAIRKVLNEVAPGRTTPDFRTLTEVQRDDRDRLLQMTYPVIAGGAVALFLGALGLYGAVATTVGERRREIGIRSSLGATPEGVVEMFLKSGLRMGIIGIVLGLPLSLIGIRILATVEAEGTLPTSYILLAGACTLFSILAVTLLATWLPARRAASVDPMTVLRVE